MLIKNISKYLFRAPDSKATFRLFFVPYAGSGASIGEPYYNLFKPEIDFMSLQLPGRENRITEEPFTDMNLLIEDLVVSLAPFLDVPFVFWGHCSGALIVFELVRKIREYFKIEPQALVVSACAAPDLAHNILGEQFHILPDREFFGRIQDLMAENFSVDEANSTAVKILLPGIRADFELYEKYQPVGKSTPLSCPILALGGEEDRLINKDHLLKWKNQTNGKFDSLFLIGQHHYFVNNCADDLSQYLKNNCYKNDFG